MNKIATITASLGLLGLLGVASAATADILDFTPFGGYTTVTMGTVNKNQAQIAGYFQLIGEESPGTHYTGTDLSNGWVVGGDLLTDRLTPWKQLSLGLRGEYLGTNPASADFTEGPESVDFKQSGSLTGIMLGGRYALPGAHYGLKLSVGLFGGLGYGTMAESLSYPGASANFSNLYTGEGFMADLDLRLDWAIPRVSWLHLNAQGGYRYASLGQFSSGGQPMGGGLPLLIQVVSPGAPRASGEDVDFSGLTAEGGLSVLF